MKTSDSKPLPDTATAGEVRGHLHRLLEIIATRLAKTWVQEHSGRTTRTKDRRHSSRCEPSIGEVTQTQREPPANTSAH